MPPIHRVLCVLCLAGSALTGLGCSSDDGSESKKPDNTGPTVLPELALPAQGFQLRDVGVDVPGGADEEYCEILALPGAPADAYYVNGFEIAMTSQSHHLIVTAVDVGSAAEASLEVGSIVRCQGSQDLAGFDQTENVTGSQTPTAAQHFPAGVGKIFHGGQKFIFDYHYLNTTDETVSAKQAVNVLTTDAANVQKIMQRSAFVNFTINTPPHQSASFTGECRFDQDVLVGAVVRHTHRWGTTFDVSDAGDGGAHIWTSNHYELDTQYTYDPPRLMKAGEGFRFTCSYFNDTNAPLKFGPKGTDEMCILFGAWWVVNETDPVARQFCTMFATDPDGISRGTNTVPGGSTG